MTRLLLFFCLSTKLLFSQTPSLTNTKSFSKADLEKYGISQSDFTYKTVKPDVIISDTLTGKNIEETKNNVVENLADSISTKKPKEKEEIYGKSFFNSDELKIYNRATHINASPNYILGSGDEINVTIWGYSEHSGLYTIENDGSISPKRVGKIYLNGQTFEQARKIISSKFGKVYDLKNSKITVKLNYSKVIRVNIVGEVNNPGTYTVPSINPVFNILGLAGGINSYGSVRNIEIRRNGEIVTQLDVYEFLKNPSYKSDLFLLDNDYIVVRMASKTVTLEGSVKKTFKYELKEEEGINHLIDFAGGFLPSAYTKTLNLYRYQKNRLEIVRINYDNLIKNQKSFLLKDGDRVFVSNVPNKIRNRVIIKGSVNIPNSYVFSEGMNIKDLVNQANGLTLEAYSSKSFLTRLNDDHSKTRIEINLDNELSGASTTTLQEFDSLHVYSKKDFKTTSVVEVLGAVRKPGEFEFTEGLTLGDALFLSGGMLPQASSKRIEISRITNFNNSTEDPVRVTIETIDVNMDLLSEIKTQTKLKRFDKVHVRLVPNFEKQQYVSIDGEVNFPGAYVLSNKSETVLDVIKRAGGLTEWAFLEGAYLKSEIGFIVFNLNDVFKKKESEFNYILRKGDKIVIPRKSNYVTLLGAVDYPKAKEVGALNLPYKQGKRAKYYINKYASGFSNKAKKSKTYVETPGGYIKKTKNFLFFKKYPNVNNGDSIYVVSKPVKKERIKEKEKLNWNGAIENITIKLTGLATLFVILSNMSN